MAVSCTRLHVETGECAGDTDRGGEDLLTNGNTVGWQRAAGITDGHFASAFTWSVRLAPHGAEVDSVSFLTSITSSGFIMVPLLVKYQTASGRRYAYDVRTGEILCVNAIVYEILDDYHVLTTHELCEKYSTLGAEKVRQAVAQLDVLQEQRLLRDHGPEISGRVASVCCERKAVPFRDFLRDRRRMLTLELTQQCNLACEYCIYGKYYSRYRQPEKEPMTLDTAKSAISRFLSHECKKPTIGFYGGEPLLEFELLKAVIAFAEPLAMQKGVDLTFQITTNGTLLSEEKIHYLVAHNVNVTISLDGDKEVHDRYRVFKNAEPTAQRRGSFDIIIANMERFVQLYPDYTRRGIVLTLTASANIFRTEDFVRRWTPRYPVFVSNFVYPVQSGFEDGCWIAVGTSPCGDEACVRVPTVSERSGEVPEFDRWSPEIAISIEAARRNLLSALSQCNDYSSAHRTLEHSPICAHLLRGEFEKIHRRWVIGSSDRKVCVTRLSCFPGCVRTFCSSLGVVYPCERIDFNKLTEIGDALNDISVDKVDDVLIEMVRLSCDCGNCIIRQICTLCPAQLSESRESPGYPDFLALQRTCADYASQPAIAARLAQYTGVLEVNPKVFDRVYPPITGEQEDWLNDVMSVLAEQKDVELTVEELKEFV